VRLPTTALRLPNTAGRIRARREAGWTVTARAPCTTDARREPPRKPAECDQGDGHHDRGGEEEQMAVERNVGAVPTANPFSDPKETPREQPEPARGL
jgi:hypothetical protein